MTLALWTWVLGWEGDSPSNFWVLPTLREGDVGAAQIVLHLFMKRKSMPHNLYIARKGRARETNSKDHSTYSRISNRRSNLGLEDLVEKSPTAQQLGGFRRERKSLDFDQDEMKGVKKLDKYK